MVRDTATISDDVVVGTASPDPETTIEALIRAYNRMALDSDLTADDLLVWDGSDVVGKTTVSLARLDMILQANAGDTILVARASGESFARFVLEADGRMRWGDGSGSIDVALYRSAADELTLDDSFVISTDLEVIGDTILQGSSTLNGDLDHTGSNVGFYGTTPVAQSSAYTPSNVTTDRTYDADATTTAELADVLGTLIADLQATGIIG